MISEKVVSKVKGFFETHPKSREIFENELLREALKEGIPVHQCEGPVPYPIGCRNQEVVTDEEIELFEKLVESKVITPFYSEVEPIMKARVFFVEKSDGLTLRPIFDYRQTNSRAPIYPFGYEPISQLILSKMNFACSLDLKDGYHHLRMNRKYKHLTVLEFNGDLYEPLLLPFGLATAPVYFSSFMASIIRDLRRNDVIISFYLDDVIILGRTREECLRNLNLTREKFKELGLTINEEKSDMEPRTSIIFRGWKLAFKNDSAYIAITEKKIKKIMNTIKELRVGRKLKALQSLNGQVEFAFLFHKNLFKERLEVSGALKGYPSGNPNMKVKLSPEFMRTLETLEEKILRTRLEPVDLPRENLIISTDASLEGAGIHIFNTGETIKLDLNMDSRIEVLETKTILRAIEYLLERELLHEGQLLHLYCDNSAAIGAIRGKAKNKTIAKLAKQIYQLAEDNRFYLTVEYIESKTNIAADAISRNEKMEDVQLPPPELPEDLYIGGNPKCFLDPLQNKYFDPKRLDDSYIRPDNGKAAKRTAVIAPNSKHIVEKNNPPHPTSVSGLPYELRERASLGLNKGQWLEGRPNFFLNFEPLIDNEGTLFLKGDQTEILHQWTTKALREGSTKKIVRHTVRPDELPFKHWLHSQRKGSEYVSSLSDLARNFITQGRRDTTNRSYDACWNRFIKFLERNLISEEEVNATYIIAYIDHLHEKGRKSSTLTSTLSSILSALERHDIAWAANIKKDPQIDLARNTLIRLRKKDNKKKNREKEFREAKAIQFSLEWYAASKDLSPRTKTVVAAMTLTGMRHNEVFRLINNDYFGIPWYDDKLGLLLHAFAPLDKGLKSGSRSVTIEYVFLGHGAGAHLVKYIRRLGKERQFLFIDNQDIANEEKVSQALRDVAMELEDLETSPHAFRHARATLDAQSGISHNQSPRQIQELLQRKLGHLSLNTIFNYGQVGEILNRKSYTQE
eukprot:TRINITY_DN3313_c0_g1_i3.p1 TRINITY_DN3313_c0_g1~~TRINITY_DN3313_c0_g1_i3.p1  ORF type:complete len:968 (-),score=40.03 TRINITY_DN3313_c0_g1_i3:525-3428(-)